MAGCSNCPYGSRYDRSSDWCDGCRNDPDTGWGGFTDHYLGRHFNNENERDAYVSAYGDEPEDIYDDDVDWGDSW